MIEKLNTPKSVNWDSKFKRLSLLVVMALLLSLIAPLTSMPAQAARVQPLLLELAAQQPDQVVSVIVQKTVKDTRAEEAVTTLGGRVTKDLHIINAFAAEMKAKDVAQLAKADGVRWVSLDAPTRSTSTLSAANNTSFASEFQTSGGYIKITNGLGGNDSFSPKVAVDSGGVTHVVFQGLTNTVTKKKDIFYANNLGGSFNAPINLSNQLGKNDALSPAIAVDSSGAAHVVFQGLNNTATKKKDVFYVTNRTGVFSAPLNLTNQFGGNDALGPAIAVDGRGVVHIVFQGLNNTVTKKKDVFYLNNQAGAFGVPVNVSNQLGNNDAVTPGLAVESSGVAHVVFQGLTDTVTKKREYHLNNQGEVVFGCQEAAN